MADPETEKIKIELFKRQKGSMLEHLFQLNPKQQEVKVQIVAKIDKSAMIVPYRSVNCKKLECLYDEEELISLYKANKKQQNFTFTCKICKTKINYNSFWLDEDLYEVVNRLFSCYNKSEVNVLEIILYKQGNYKPIFLKKPGASFVLDVNMPSIRDYTEEEYVALKDALQTKGKGRFATNDIIINRMGLPLTFEQLELLQEEETVSVALMAFLLTYVKNEQDFLFSQRNARGFEVQKKNICLIALVVYGFTADERQLDSDYLTNFENLYSTEELVNDYENIAIVIYYEKTWSLLLVDLHEKASYFFIFKDHMKQEYMKVISMLILEQLDLHDSVINYSDNFAFHSPSESKFSAALVFRMVMWLVDPPNNIQPFSSFSKEQIDIIRKQTSIIEWLILLLMSQEEKNNDIFREALVKKSQSNNANESMPSSIISLNAIKSDTSSNFHETSISLLDEKQGKKKKNKVQPNHLIKEEEDEEEDEDLDENDSNAQFSTHSQDQDQASMPLDGRNFQELFNQVKKKYANDNLVAIPKNDFQNLIDKLQYDVAKELERKRLKEDIEKETLADYYVNQKIQEFNVQVKKPKQKKQKKRNNGEEDDDENGQDEIQQMSNEEMLEKQKLQLSLGELKNILHQFEKDMHQRIDFKQGNAVFDAIDQERQAAEYMESYDTFVHLLHYYYNNDINAYKALIDEYNFRYHNMLFQKLGLGMQASNNSAPPPQNNKTKGLNINGQDDQQQQQSLLPRDILSPNNSGNNSSFISQQNNNNSKPNKPLVGFNQSSSSSRLGLAGQQVVAKGNTNQNNQKSWMQDSSVMGMNYNEKLIEDQEKRVLVERYGKTFTEGDIRKLRSGNILSEEGLNFFVKFLDERQDHQMYIFRINQKQFPRGMRLLFLSSNFYTYFTKNDPLQVDRLDFIPVRAYMKSFSGAGQTIFEKFDKICIPIQLRLAEMHLAVIDFLRKEIVLYITSEFSDYPPKPVNNPIMQNLLRFIQKELYEKKLQNLNFITWQHRYVFLDDSLRQAHKQSVLNTAYVLNILSKQREYEKESNDLFYAFHERLVRLFLQIGLTKNAKNELIFENLPL